MSARLVTAHLGSVLTKANEVVELYPDRTYKQVTIRLWGQGVVQRNEVLGAEIAGSKRYLVRAGQFILSRIDARNGAFGLVPEDLDGAVVSNDFPAFEVDRSQMIPTYLRWISRTRSFINLCKQASEGTTNRVRLSEAKFLATPIPLPPLEEQRRIVTRIEGLAAKIEEARGLRRQAVQQRDATLDASITAILKHPALAQSRVRLGNADLQINRESRDPARGGYASEFVYVDISSVGKGPSVVHRGKVLSSKEAPSRARRVIRTDDVIISTVRPNLRGFAKVGADLDNQICSTGFAVLTCGESIDPDFLLYQLCSPIFSDQSMSRVTGGHYPAINDRNLREIEIIVPPLSEQRRIVRYLDKLQAKVETLKALQVEASVELEALLPSILDKAFKGGYDNEAGPVEPC